MTTIAENIQTLRSIKSGIKQAITDKGGSVGNDFKTYAQAITDLPSGGGGGTENEDGLITRTISVYSNDRVSMVGDYAFYSYSTLKSVDLPNCKSIGYYVFERCTALQSFNLPLCEYIGNRAFTWCSGLSIVNLPNCISIGEYLFGYCSGLSIVNLPNCKSVNSFAFKFCSILTNVNSPLCDYFGKEAFANCANLAQVYLNSVTSVTTIKSDTFSNCPNLTSVYVPSSLVYAFKTAQYWSSISSKIVAYREVVEQPDPGIGGEVGGDTDAPIE